MTTGRWTLPMVSRRSGLCSSYHAFRFEADVVVVVLRKDRTSW